MLIKSNVMMYKVKCFLHQKRIFFIQFATFTYVLNAGCADNVCLSVGVILASCGRKKIVYLLCVF